MIKVNVSVMVEPTDEWLRNFNLFFNTLRQLNWVNSNGEIIVSSENNFEDIFSIARENDIRLIIHS